QSVHVRGKSVVSDLGDQRAVIARIRLCAELPDADLFSRNVEVSQFIVGDTAFGRGAEAERAHSACFDGPVARILKQILFDLSLLVVNDEVEPPAFGATIGAGTVGFA